MLWDVRRVTEAKHDGHEQMDNETKRQEAVQTRVVLYRNAQNASMG
jgi:hypothetical protein